MVVTDASRVPHQSRIKPIANWIRVGIVGAGFVAREHIAMLNEVPTAHISCIFDIDGERSADLATEVGAIASPSLEALMAESDAVFVCTWTSEHAGIVAATARVGLPVFSEKPLSTDLASASSMLALVEESDIVHQVGLVLRYSPAFALLRNLIQDERSGQLLTVQMRSDQYIPIQGAYASTWRADVSRAGAGVLLEHSIHDLDILDLLFGPVIGVNCITRNLHGYPGIDDIALVQLHVTSGAPVGLTTLWHDILERPEARRLEVFCERLWCALDGNYFSGPVTWRRVGESKHSVAGHELIAAADSSTTFNEDAAFVGSVLSGRPAYPDFAIGVRAHELVDAAYRSASIGGERVAIPLRAATSNQ